MQTKSSKFIFSMLLLISLIASTSSNAQPAPQTPRRIDVYMQVAPGDTTMHPGERVFHESTKLTGTVFILLTDTSNIQTIHVSIGSIDGGSDIFERSFDNVPATYNDGTSLTRKGNKTYIGIGSFTGLNTIYAEAYLEGPGGTSSIVYFEKQ